MRNNLPSIFEPFFTTKGERGTGLGLWVTRGIVEEQGGPFASARDQGTAPGTTIRITLPASRPWPPTSDSVLLKRLADAAFRVCFPSFRASTIARAWHCSTQAKQKNVLGQPLETCGGDPMTGFYRDGCCNTGPDEGLHTVCCIVNERSSPPPLARATIFPRRCRSTVFRG